MKITTSLDEKSPLGSFNESHPMVVDVYQIIIDSGVISLPLRHEVIVITIKHKLDPLSAIADDTITMVIFP